MPRRSPYSVTALALGALALLLTATVGVGGWWWSQQRAEQRKDADRILALESAVRDAEITERDHAAFVAGGGFKESVEHSRTQQQEAIGRMNEYIAERNAIVRRRPEFGLKEMEPRTVKPLK